ncbi:unnamed protein product [Pseudo-nitzschia multistriata]|uniref:Uncharacterized protein n=1 Tax=Pseudo-nitzschia multistriata TaxID=183589 RepID=A0A448ZG37_9STRA|nr:unnamed protein product [Pseudo-nitzschia multistriata]
MKIRTLFQLFALFILAVASAQSSAIDDEHTERRLRGPHKAGRGFNKRPFKGGRGKKGPYKGPYKGGRPAKKGFNKGPYRKGGPGRKGPYKRGRGGPYKKGWGGRGGRGRQGGYRKHTKSF